MRRSIIAALAAGNQLSLPVGASGAVGPPVRCRTTRCDFMSTTHTAGDPRSGATPSAAGSVSVGSVLGCSSVRSMTEGPFRHHTRCLAAAAAVAPSGPLASGVAPVRVGRARYRSGCVFPNQHFRPVSKSHPELTRCWSCVALRWESANSRLRSGHNTSELPRLEPPGRHFERHSGPGDEPSPGDSRRSASPYSRSISPRHAPVSTPRDSMNCLNRSRSPSTRRFTNPSLSPTFSVKPSGS